MDYIRVMRLEEIELMDLIKLVKSGPDSGRIGCVVSFIGVVREESIRGVVEKLQLDLSKDLEDKLRGISVDVGRKYGVINTLIYHNSGEIDSGDAIMYILVSAEHRGEAFDALQEIVDEVRKGVHVDLREFMK
ncbi:MAG: molybdenum cofactor biosynthesis protein MoaE [Candidatus Altiarchaeota archaeon]|nr:molybdenum cofactor biosynthesis protein MoaE [Candidatus Altiarchaeota archaeon]